jgi:hypothetical protein
MRVTLKMNRDSVVGIVIRLRAAKQGSHGSIPGRGKSVRSSSLFQSVQRPDESLMQCVCLCMCVCVCVCVYTYIHMYLCKHIYILTPHDGIWMTVTVWNFYWCSSDRQQFSGLLLWNLGVTSLVIMGASDLLSTPLHAHTHTQISVISRA